MQIEADRDYREDQGTDPEADVKFDDSRALVDTHLFEGLGAFMNAPPRQQRDRGHDQLCHHPIHLKVDQPVRRVRYQAQHHSDCDYDAVHTHFNSCERLLLVLDKLKQAALARPNRSLEKDRALVIVRSKLPVQQQKQHHGVGEQDLSSSIVEAAQLLLVRQRVHPDEYPARVHCID